MDDAPEERRWGLGDVVAGLVVGIVVSQVVLAILLAATGRTIDEVDDLPLSLVLLAQAGLWVGLLGAPYLATRRKGQGLVADLHVRAERRDLWVGGSVGVVLQVVVLPLLYWPILELTDQTSSDLESSARDIIDRAEGPIGVILLVLIVGVGAPVVEEIFYRGLLLGALRKRGMGPAPAIVVTAVVFGVSHFEGLPLPGLVVFGLGAGVLAHRAGRLGPAIAAHVAFNLVSVAALLGS